MKQFKFFAAFLIVIATFFALMLLPQCTTTSQPCSLPAPNSARVDSFTPNQTHISWSQVVGNNGYRIRIIEVGSTAPAIIDTTVAINDTNFVAVNLPFNKALEAQIRAICPNNSVSPNFKALEIEGIVIVDEPVIFPPIGTSTGCPTGSINCYEIDKLPASVNFQTQSSSAPTKNFVIQNFLQTPRKHYRIVIKKGNNVVSDFRLLHHLPPVVANVFVISKACSIKPPENYSASNNAYKWQESSSTNGSILRLIIDNANNRVILQSNSLRSFTVYSSTSYSKQCSKFTGVPNN